MNKKVSVVMSLEELMSIAICLTESPVLKNRIVALKIKEAMDELNSKEGGKSEKG